MIPFNYECVEKDGVKKTYFLLDSFPSAKFCYENIRIGEPDEENMVPVMFDLDFLDIPGIDDVQNGDDLEDQIKELLVHLLQSANNRIVSVINSPKTKGLTSP